MNGRKSRFEGLLLACLFAVAIMFLSFLRTLGDTGSMRFRGAVLDSVVGTPLLGTALGGDLLRFVLGQLFVHLVFGVLCWTFAVFAQESWPKVKTTRRQWVLIWLIAGTGVAFVSNAALYPWTSLGEPYSSFATAKILGVPLYTLLVGAFILGIVAGVSPTALRWLARRTPIRAPLNANSSRWIVGGLTAFGIAAAVAIPAVREDTKSTHVLTKPNIILIGIDSLRHDYPLSTEGREVTPHIAEFMDYSVVFDNAITPLARTFPSWVSILTGKHPHTTGAFINLLPRDQIHTGVTLPQALREAGYRTMYAIDEVRFSNVDDSFGFDQTITPPIGASDFLVGEINDAPITNLIANTRIGAWLFPQSYANRGAATLYDPNEFIQRIARGTDFSTPSMLATHLTLLHWPFTWADSPPLPSSSRESVLEIRYQMAAKRVDQQFADLIDVLRQKGALDNAIVVLLSDHGEALGKRSEANYPADDNREDPTQLSGHGNSVFSPHQYRVVLAVRTYGSGVVASSPGRVVGAPVSVEDIYPSVVDILGIHSRERFDGLSLRPLLEEAEDSIPASFHERIRFTESEFNPKGIGPGQAMNASAIRAARQYYDIVPQTGRVQIKPAWVTAMLKQRQYAAIKGERLVAAVPEAGGVGFRYYVVDSENDDPRELMWDLSPDHETANLVQALKARFASTLR